LVTGSVPFEGSQEYADYREQLIGESQVSEMAAAYQEQAGVPTDAKEFVSERQEWLRAIGWATDLSFSENDAAA
jgi:hypothetical protein